MKNINYADIPIVECGEPMVDLSSFPFSLEPTQFRKGFTQNPQLWLRQSAAMKLESAQRDFLEPKQLRFKIFDAWRPRSVQNKVYAACWNALSARNPEWTEDQLTEATSAYAINGYDAALIPPHTTGGAVDLTLIDDRTGAELDMGSAYCQWTDPRIMCPDKAGPDAGICENLRSLIIACQSAGFMQDPRQWWHFDYGNQKWAALSGAGTAIYGELDAGMGFMKKGAALGHGAALPYEMR